MPLIENRVAGNHYIYEFERHDTRLIVLKDMVTVDHPFKAPQHFVRGLAPPRECWWGRPEIEIQIEVGKFNKNSMGIVRFEQYRGDKFWEHDWETHPPDVTTHYTGDFIKCKNCGMKAQEFTMPFSLSCSERVIKDIIE